MKPSRFLILATLLATAALSFGSLNVGDSAPELKVANWVKGSRVELGKGKPVVVEFWATWCGPCKTSIPHISEMAKKLAGKVDFVGVSVWESAPEDYTTKVPAMVKAFGDKMSYNVATDTADQHMANQWMKAAGENGIPAAFLIDGEGKVAWIGHPMDGLDKAIDDLMAGKLDLAKARAARETAKMAEAEEMQKQEALQAKFAPIGKALQTKKYAEAVKLMDELEKSDPSVAPMLVGARFSAMVSGKLPGLDKKLIAMSNDAKVTDPAMINQMIWPIIEKKQTLSPSVLKAVVKLGEKMMKLAPKDAMNMDTYALALWRAGDKKKALSTQKMAVELAKKDSRIDSDTLKEMQARLKEFGGK